jgi:glycosyltransferase involved in cell wall biosynthesis
MNILIISDAWEPQVNGVVRNYKSLIKVFEARGLNVRVISPNEFTTIPCPTYPEISLSLFPGRKLERLMLESKPDFIHLPTEGPLGWAAQAICKKKGWPFSTCYHSKFPEYVHERFRVPVSLTYGVLRKFHQAGGATMVTNADLKTELAERGFTKLALRRVGVDHGLFRPMVDKTYLNFLKLPRPLWVCHGRVAPEKNLEGFMNLDLPGSKIVIGPGPLLEKYKRQYPKVHFTGYLPDDEMVKYIASSDAFVFPSLTETFGFVQLEALACGVPVAAFPVTGPKAVLGGSPAGVMDTNLARGALAALAIKPDVCRARALNFSWEEAADDVLDAFQPLPHVRPEAADEAKRPRTGVGGQSRAAVVN